MKYMRSVLGVVAGIPLLFNLTGCVPLVVGAAAGAGTIAFIQGILEKNLDAPMAQVHKAAVAGLKDLDYFVIVEEVSLESVKIKAEDAGKKEINIEIKPLTDKASTIRIRVGTFGNEEVSLQILNAVEKRL